MANILQALLGMGQAGPSGLPTPQEDIVVNAAPPPQRTAPPQDFSQEVTPRSGMFGVKGTLRDVLGLLGDAFLVNAGRNAVYAPKRQQEKESDAIYGFTENPMEAAERLGTHNAQAGMGLYDKAIDNQVRQAQVESMGAARESQVEQRKADLIKNLRNYAARALQEADTPEKQAYALQLAEGYATKMGLTLEDLGIDPNMSPEQREIYANTDMTVNQQQMFDHRDSSLKQDESQFVRAERGRMARDNPPSPPARPRADTELEYYRSINSKPPSQQTPSEKAFVKRYLEGTGGKKRSRIGGAPPPPPSSGAAPSRFRIVN